MIMVLYDFVALLDLSCVLQFTLFFNMIQPVMLELFLHTRNNIDASGHINAVPYTYYVNTEYNTEYTAKHINL